MKFKVLKPISSRHDGRLYMPGEIYDDAGRSTPYEIEQLQTLGVYLPLPEPQPNPPESKQERA